MGTAKDGIEHHEQFLLATRDLLHPNHYQVLQTREHFRPAIRDLLHQNHRYYSTEQRTIPAGCT
jgi:hypothetical protein